MDPLSGLAALTTPHLADAAVRLGLELRAPVGIAARTEAARSGLCWGRVRPVRHHGSVDVFLEAIDQAEPGDVLAVDNGGLLDEGCIGDLVAREAVDAGIAAIVIWGAHRDTPLLDEIGVRLFSLGSYPAGPVALRARPADALARASLGGFEVTREDQAFGDSDGVLFLPAFGLDAIVRIADEIRRTELVQAERTQAGTSLRAQFQFSAYLDARARDPGFTFRQHLRRRGAAIEE